MNDMKRHSLCAPILTCERLTVSATHSGPEESIVQNNGTGTVHIVMTYELVHHIQEYPKLSG